MNDARTVLCSKLQQNLPGLKRAPFPNELGQRIYENISEQAWQEWLAHSTKLINEYRVDLLSKQGTEFLLKECEKFLFGEGSENPPDFKPAA